MKSAVKALAFLTVLGAALAHAQSLPNFQHVIIVIQENRSPDNLFGGAVAAAGYPPGFPTLPSGVDIGPLKSDAVPWCLGACFDPDHGNNAWTSQEGGVPGGSTYNSCPQGQTVTTTYCVPSQCNAQQVCTGAGCSGLQLPSGYPNQCFQDTYVSLTYDNQPTSEGGTFGGYSPVLPYFDIAHKYGFANYFYQTNQGPSQPAHDFLFGGTSAPAGSSNQTDYMYGQYWQEFAASNPDNKSSAPNDASCYYTGSVPVTFIFPNGQGYDPSLGFNNEKGYTEPPCYDHQTLADLLDSNGLTWRYYTNHLYDIWSAPSGIQHLCLTGEGFPNECNTQYYTGTGNPYNIPNVITPPQTFLADGFVTPGGTNLPNQTYCDLPSVTWLIPNGGWSDHPGFGSSNASSTDTEDGPDWVASIINAVGNAQCKEPSGPYEGQSPWLDTVIFVVWDDWGGFYDHLGAEGAYQVQVNCSNFGCGYTYGWRVPFLVVSAYTPQGYVSGACGVANYPSCGSESNVPPYQHDFGSILAFVENNFLGQSAIGTINSSVCPTGATGCFLFADANAPEWVAKPVHTNLPLGDFFGLWQNGGPRTFDSIQIVGDFTPSYFQNYNGPVTDPDNDVIENIDN
jgi:phospholipase C